MRSSKSQKSMSIITERKSHHDILVQPQSCITMQKTPHNLGSFGFKNVTQQSEHQHAHSQSASGKKHRRQRSTSVQSRGEWCHENNNEQRKKQLDYLCLQKILNIIKKYQIQKQQSWNLQLLTYQHIIKLLWLCRYVKYRQQQQYIQNNQHQQLKKIYLLWLSISVRKYVKFRDFVTFLQIVENINVEKERIQGILYSFQMQIKSLVGNCETVCNEDPKFTFFMKKIQVKRDSNQMHITDYVRNKFIQEFKIFKLNKLKNNGLIECVKVEDSQVLISKKSSQLAEQKRKKIQSKIREKKPHVENINLLDLLSYRERDHQNTAACTNQKKITINVNPSLTPSTNNPSTPTPNLKKPQSHHYRRGELKKQIQLLSRPKTYFEQRRQDEINYEKEEEEYTFHPKVHSYKNNGKEKVMYIRNADKMLVRMKEARKLKEEKENILQKGWSNCYGSNTSASNTKANQHTKLFYKSKSNHIATAQTQNCCQKQNIDTQKQNQCPPQSEPSCEKPQKYEVSKDYLKIPILFIDVNIEEGKKQRIIIYDNDKAETLAKQFGAKHKLSEETVHRLEGLLQQQMDTVLARIEEETDDQGSFLY